MNDIQSVMKFELLPNEILTKCFEYFNAFDLFYSFDELNNRFNNLIRHIPLYINFQNVNKLIFDQFCIKMSLNPEIKNQIYSLQIFESECLQGNTFLSTFPINKFPNLQQFESDLSLITSWDVRQMQMQPPPHLKINRDDLMFSQLRSLSISYLRCSKNIDKISSITNLTVSECVLEHFYFLVEHAPMLKYLYIGRTQSWLVENVDTDFSGQCAAHLKELIIGEFTEDFEIFEKFIKATPNLKSLTVSASNNEEIVDAGRWEQLITSLLPYLNIFKFKFSCYYSEEKDKIIVDKFKQFQTDFWQKQHHWFTEYDTGNGLASIYTIPYISYMYKLTTNVIRYCNNLISNVNTFTNVTYLIVDQTILTENCQYYFPNVRNLRLIQSDDDFLRTEHVQYLKKIVNLFNIKHLDISDVKNIEDPLVLLPIFEEAPYLSSMNIGENNFQPIFNDSRLHKYLNKMIKRLFIGGKDWWLSSDQSFGAEQLCEIFTNVEHLQCTIGHQDHLLFLLDHLPKLFTLEVRWFDRDDDERHISQFENEAQKRNLIYDITTYNRQVLTFDGDRLGDDPEGWECERQISIWIGENMT